MNDGFYRIFLLLFFFIIFAACSKQTDKGMGPVKNVNLGPIDSSLVLKGKEIFEKKCIYCHNFNSQISAPSLKGVTLRRKPEWIMNMIINPLEMTMKDDTAKQLLKEYTNFQMPYLNVKEEDARAILEYLRDMDK